MRLIIQIYQVKYKTDRCVYLPLGNLILFLWFVINKWCLGRVKPTAKISLCHLPYVHVIMVADVVQETWDRLVFTRMISRGYIIGSRRSLWWAEAFNDRNFELYKTVWCGPFNYKFPQFRLTDIFISSLLCSNVLQMTIFTTRYFIW